MAPPNPHDFPFHRRAPAALYALAVWMMSAAGAGCASRPPLPPEAVLHNERGAAALSRGAFEVAAAELGLALEYGPRFTEAWVNLGLLQLERGELETARRTLRKARALNPNLPAPHHALGLWAESTEAPALAERHYQDALRVDPGFAPARANLGRLLFRRAAWEEAREQFLRLTQAAPASVEGAVGLVESQLRLGRFGDADATLVAALARLGQRPELVLLDARRALRRGDVAHAEVVLRGLLTDGAPTRRASAHAFLAVARLAKGELDGARHAATAALALDGEQSVARYVLAQISSR